MSTVLITGANRGLGLEFAVEYAAEGWTVFAACRKPDEAEELNRLVKESGTRTSIVAMDVTDNDSVREASTELKDVAIDVLINNAGVGGPRGQTTGNVDFEAWRHVLDVTTLGPLRVLEAFTEQLADMGGPGARLTPAESVGAMRKLIAKLGPSDSGKFLHYDGREYPW